ncbi:hypothetical protein, partial [Nonomuraea jabiensis]|uniref:hypothetical protein n=1 Tax=Nonomuraea jabiensis TaxID=882448 RepID=UPI0036B23E64
MRRITATSYATVRSTHRTGLYARNTLDISISTKSISRITEGFSSHFSELKDKDRFDELTCEKWAASEFA